MDWQDDSSPWELNTLASLEFNDEELQRELKKIDLALQNNKDESKHVKKIAADTRTSQQIELQRFLNTKTEAEIRSEAYLNALDEQKKHRQYLRKYKAFTDAKSFENFRRMVFRIWNSKASLKMVKVYKATPRDYALAATVWTYAEKDIKRGLEIIYHGIEGLKLSYYYKTATSISFAQAFSKDKMINYALNVEGSKASGNKKFDLASSGDSLSYDDNVAVFDNEVLVMILKDMGNKCLVAINTYTQKIVDKSKLEPCNDLAWYSYADEELFKDTQGYKKYKGMS